jgi:tetratricopeptide (TPR) repeat protein
MGVVYAAYDPELDRKVAIKLVPRGSSDVDGSATRLLREAQSMARLSHPNVVAVYDVGSIDAGVYIAMEHIDGATLTRWLAERERTLREILRVFEDAGRGIQAAHAAGLVHRDFKPDNVMIGLDGRVRVLDFGLARPSPRSLDGDANPRIESSGGWSAASHLELDLTVPGTVMGTPRYMAPEQHLGKGADERSDIYAYCIALWEAVYRARSFTAGSLSELARKIIAGEVDTPSSHRGVPRWLRAVLRRGMAPSPSLRFASMAELLVALARGREARTRNLAIAAGVVGLAAFAGFGAQYGARPLPCEGAKAVLEGVWDPSRKAEAEASFEREGKTYTAASWRAVERELDAYAAGLVAMRREACEATRVSGTQSDEVLGRRMACLDRRVQRLSTLTGALAEGGTATILRAVEAAHGLPDLAPCADVERLLGGVALAEDPAVRAAVEEVRIELDRIEGLGVAGAIDGMEASVSAALERARTTGYRPIIAEALLLRGRLLANLSRPEEARVALLEGLDHAEATGHDPIIVELVAVLIRVEGGTLANFDAGELYVRRGHAVLERLGGDKQLEFRLVDEEGGMRNSQGRDDEAVTLMRRADALAVELGSDGPRRLQVLNGLASALMGAGRYDEASEVILESQTIVEGELGPEHPNAGALYAMLGRLRHEQLRDAEALELLARARRIFVAALGANHNNVAAVVNGIGLVLSSQGKQDEAHAAYTEALAILDRGPQHLGVATTLQNLAHLEIARGEGAVALERMQRVIDIRAPRLGAGHESVGLAKDLLGDAYALVGDADAARRTYRESIAVFEALDDRPHQAYGHAGLARLLVAERRWVEAIAACERAIALQDDKTDPVYRGRVRVTLAHALHGAHRDAARVGATIEEARVALRSAGITSAAELAALERWAAEIADAPTMAPP